MNASIYDLICRQQAGAAPQRTREIARRAYTSRYVATSMLQYHTTEAKRRHKLTNVFSGCNFRSYGHASSERNEGEDKLHDARVCSLEADLHYQVAAVLISTAMNTERKIACQYFTSRSFYCYYYIIIIISLRWLLSRCFY